jgi:hypothetical protein
VEWPAERTTGSFRIGILGTGDVLAPLEDVVRGKTVNGRPIRTELIGSAGEAEQCEILLIERSELKHLKEILGSLAGKPVLTVCDGGACAKAGAMIAFQIVEDSVRFQIHQEPVERAGLKISSQLLKTAYWERHR